MTYAEVFPVSQIDVGIFLSRTYRKNDKKPTEKDLRYFSKSRKKVKGDLVKILVTRVGLEDRVAVTYVTPLDDQMLTLLYKLLLKDCDKKEAFEWFKKTISF